MSRRHNGLGVRQLPARADAGPAIGVSAIRNLQRRSLAKSAFLAVRQEFRGSELRECTSARKTSVDADALPQIPTECSQDLFDFGTDLRPREAVSCCSTLEIARKIPVTSHPFSSSSFGQEAAVFYWSWRCSTRTTTAPASNRSISSTASPASRCCLRRLLAGGPFAGPEQAVHGIIRVVDVEHDARRRPSEAAAVEIDLAEPDPCQRSPVARSSPVATASAGSSGRRRSRARGRRQSSTRDRSAAYRRHRSPRSRRRSSASAPLPSRRSCAGRGTDRDRHAAVR